MSAIQPPVPLAKVVGGNCRRIRTDGQVTRNGLAKYARAAGLRWTDSKVGDFESGRSAPTFATLIAVTVALSNALRRTVTLADLVTFDGGRVIVTDQIVLAGAKLVAAARSAPWFLDQADIDASLDVEIADQLERGRNRRSVDEIVARSGLDESRLAKRMKMTDAELASISLQAWGRSFSDERDRRAGEDANPQKRGRVSRDLRAELEKLISDGSH